MTSSVTTAWRDVIGPVVVCIALPTPLLLFWHSPVGRGYALMLFFVGCMGLVAQLIWHELRQMTFNPTSISRDEARHRMREILIVAGVSLAVVWVAFTLECILINNPYNYGTPAGMADQGIWWRAVVFESPRDFAAPILAALSIAVSICIVPFMTLLTRNRFAAVVFSGTLVACMKFAGAIVVVAKYGWYANEEGHMTLPWHKPDLLVWLFLGFSTLLSIACCTLGNRRFVQVVSERRAAELRPSAYDTVIVK
jgi:hypothetical protein